MEINKSRTGGKNCLMGVQIVEGGGECFMGSKKKTISEIKELVALYFSNSSFSIELKDYIYNDY